MSEIVKKIEGKYKEPGTAHNEVAGKVLFQK